MKAVNPHYTEADFEGLSSEEVEVVAASVGSEYVDTDVECTPVDCASAEGSGSESSDDPDSSVDDPQASCNLVDSFQCGFEANCADGVINATWHEHSVPSSGQGDEIREFECEFMCPNGCVMDDSDPIWPDSGVELVDALCL